MRNRLVVGLVWVVGFLAPACGVYVARDDPAPEPRPVQAPLGWSLRDDVPYERVGHSAVLDEENDRMIVFGGVANDTWELPLSGPNANVWKELKATGEFPPSHTYSGPLPDSAVYDARGHRLLLFVNATSFSGGTRDINGLWQLPLQGPLVWSALHTTGDAPEGRAKIAVDVDGNRLFAVSDAVWSMPLDAMGAWTRLAELPGEWAYVREAATVVVDRPSQRLIVSSLTNDQPDAAWALSLDTNEWVSLGRNSDSTGAATVFDEKRDRFVSFGGANGSTVYIATVGPDGVEFTTKEVTASGESFAAGVLDAKRNRILYFGGFDNAVTSIDLDTFEWAKVVKQTRVNSTGTAASNFVWDPLRSKVVGFGDYRTRLRRLGASDDWGLLSLDSFGSEQAASVYDSAGKAVISFGDYNAIGLVEPTRLASDAYDWEPIHAGEGPTARSFHVAVYDEANRRMIVHGGRTYAADVGYFDLDDAWALTLDGSPAWVPLEPDGTPPRARRGHVGIYDPEGQRMIIYGGSSESDLTDLWSLSLDDAPRWTELTASGNSPGAFGGFGRCSAVYDPEHRRMVVISFSALGAARVFALELGDTPTWHEFCSPGITPSGESNIGSGNAVLVPDGLFFSTGGASFRFDLETPYCEG